MNVHCLYQSDPQDGAHMGMQRKVCRGAARKLHWNVTNEFVSESRPETPLLMRPAVKAVLRAAANGRFQTLVIESTESMLCSEGDLECLLTIFRNHRIHVFSAQKARWVEPGGRSYSPPPTAPWRQDNPKDCANYL